MNQNQRRKQKNKRNKQKKKVGINIKIAISYIISITINIPNIATNTQFNALTQRKEFPFIVFATIFTAIIMVTYCCLFKN
ncbi:hypothetical protein G4W71_17785 [Clostridium botulinum]|uniref:hypothetical protein n=1 Tax=Clostridium botulinum TaxID=1491 RepID=UPI001788A697|nr:hypothetical protein [Clostridium botulinum]MBE1305858.1 hypothetical protein [Clostridium botulinum]